MRKLRASSYREDRTCKGLLLLIVCLLGASPPRHRDEIHCNHLKTPKIRKSSSGTTMFACVWQDLGRAKLVQILPKQNWPAASQTFLTASPKLRLDGVARSGVEFRDHGGAAQDLTKIAQEAVSQQQNGIRATRV